MLSFVLRLGHKNLKLEKHCVISCRCFLDAVVILELLVRAYSSTGAPQATFFFFSFNARVCAFWVGGMRVQLYAMGCPAPFFVAALAFLDGISTPFVAQPVHTQRGCPISFSYGMMVIMKMGGLVLLECP